VRAEARRAEAGRQAMKVAAEDGKPCTRSRTNRLRDFIVRMADCRLTSGNGSDGPTRKAPVRERRGFFYL
jgi:hypothetical protein